MPLIANNPGAAAVRIATAIVWGFLLIFATVLSSYADNRVALVIGNSSYASVAALGLPATHAVEIMFRLPPDFPAGGISNVPGILMKQAEQTRGVLLAGLLAYSNVAGERASYRAWR
jgi:hypothetical protein